MAKRNSCCLAAFLIVLVLIGGTIAAGYFGGNYALKRYLGDEGELFQLGINNWSDLFDFLSGTGKILKGKPEIDENDQPNQQNLESAHTQLESSIVGYDSETSFLGSGNLIFRTPLKLTGGQLAALIDDELTSLKEDSGLELSVSQVKLEVDANDNNYCVIIMTLSINKDNIIEPIKDKLGPFASILTSSLGDKIYLTSVNRYQAENGEIKIDSSYTQSNLYIGNGSNSSINETIIELLVSLFKAEDKNDLNADFGGIIIEAVNKVGKVSFENSSNVSYIVFDNHYNSDLIQKLLVTAEIDLADYNNLNESNKAALADIKQKANNMLANLAGTELTETTTPTLAQVQNIINDIELDNTVFLSAYQSDPAAVDLTNYQNDMDALAALFS